MSTLLLLLAACQAPSAPGPLRLVAGPAQPQEPAEAVAAADLDGDGRDELIRLREGAALWLDQQAELGGTVQGVARGDIDGDGLEEAIIATGVGRQDRSAPIRLWAVHADQATLLWEHQAERAQVADLHVLPGAAGQADRVFLAVFADERTVTGGFLEQGALDELVRERMALRMLPLGDGSVLVGRLYGDAPKSPGDLQRFTANGERQELTSHRGVRALAAADLDGDGAQEWLVGDGWHFAYGEHADPDLRLFPGGAPQRSRVIARLDGSYTVEQLEVATPPGGQPVILATGSHGAYLLQRDGLGWDNQLLAELGEVDNAVLLRRGAELAVALSGRPARIIPLAAAAP